MVDSVVDTTPTPSGLSQQPVSLQKPPPSGPPPPGPSGPPPPGLLPPGLPPPQSLPQQINYESMPPLEDATDLIEEVAIIILMVSPDGLSMAFHTKTSIDYLLLAHINPLTFNNGGIQK